MTVKRELILQNIETVLQSITIANGYSNAFTAATVQRWNVNSQPSTARPFLVVSAGQESITEGPGTYYSAKLSVIIDVFSCQLSDDPQPTDAILNSLIADINKALLADITRGGIAIRTVPQDVTPFVAVDDQSQFGVTIQYEIHYRYTIDNQ